MEHGGANSRRKRKMVTIDLTEDAPPCVVDLTETDDVPPPVEVAGPSPATPAPAGPSKARDCPVCMDAVGTEGPITALGCFHIFCRPCIARCITTQRERHRSPDCPVCKRLIPPEEQRTCGVDPSDAAGGSAAYGPAIDMFAVDLEGPGPPDAARLGGYADTYVRPGLRTVRTGLRAPASCVPYAPGAQGSLPLGPTHCTPAVRVPALGMPYVPRTVTSQAGP
jgi:hypothetical protein